MDQPLSGVKKFSGRLSVPGDKSISHRALMFSAIARGTSFIRGLSSGRDVASTAGCLRSLGVEITEGEPGTLLVRGAGRDGLRAPAVELDAGNSGTTIRLLSGILAGQAFSTRIGGDRYLCQRPMGRIIEPLERMGARILSTGGGKPPLTISGGALKGIRYVLPVASAQVKSCVLLAGLFAGGRTTVVEKVASRDHTERMLSIFGIPVKKEGLEVALEGGAELEAAEVVIPGDPSSAAFFAAAAAILPGDGVRIDNLCLNPTRAAFFEALKEMGASVRRVNERTQAGEPVADLLISGGRLSGCRIGGEILPSLIDEVPALAVVASQAGGLTVIRDAAELRVKETDRLKAVSDNLTRMGAVVRELPDGLEIEGPVRLKGARLDSYGDHRIAMAFAVAALAAEGGSLIEDAGCADISFPGFFPLLRELSSAAP